MSWYFLGNALLFFGGFAFQLGLTDKSPDESEAETGLPDTPDTPWDAADAAQLYDPDTYFSETFGTDAADAIDGADGPAGQAFFLGVGADTLNGTGGDDYASGGAGDDLIETRLGDDIGFGGAGDDFLDGGLDDDTLFGEAGNDTITGNKDDDEIHGGAGDDKLIGSDGFDSISGEAGNDTLYGNLESLPGSTDDGDDTLDGGEGDDVLHLGGGDQGTGGAGADSFNLYANSDDGAEMATITDYNPEEDVVAIFYTPQVDAGTGDPVDPVLTVTPNAEGTAATLTLDGTDVGVVTGGQDLTADDVALIAEEAE